MAALDLGEDSEMFYDEARSHVHESLQHLRWFKDFMRRTGTLKEAEEVGWVWGDPAYWGGGMWETETEQLCRILLILGVDFEDLWICDTMHVNEDVARISDPDTGDEVDTGDEDLLVVFRSKKGSIRPFLDRAARIDTKYPSTARLVRYSDMEDKGSTLADAFAIEEEKNNPRLALLLDDLGMEPYLIYDTVFERVIRAWEETKREQSTGRIHEPRGPKPPGRDGGRSRKARRRRARAIHLGRRRRGRNGSRVHNP